MRLQWTMLPHRSPVLPSNRQGEATQMPDTAASWCGMAWLVYPRPSACPCIVPSHNGDLSSKESHTILMLYALTYVCALHYLSASSCFPLLLRTISCVFSAIILSILQWIQYATLPRVLLHSAAFSHCGVRVCRVGRCIISKVVDGGFLIWYVSHSLITGTKRAKDGSQGDTHSDLSPLRS